MFLVDESNEKDFTNFSLVHTTRFIEKLKVGKVIKRKLLKLYGQQTRYWKGFYFMF